MIIVCVISFFLDNFLSNLCNQIPLTLPLCSLLCLVIIYPYMTDQHSKFLSYSILLGLLYDLTYTSTLFLNTLIFFLLALIIVAYHRYIPVNIVSVILCTLIVIILYRCMIYGVLVIVGVQNFSWNTLWQSIYNSLLLNYIYVLLGTFILKKRNSQSVYKKINKKR